ncbi:hypothetical protein HAZT_HAZT004748 [Hyalella azteca]|uniref:Uncharacterized protein n=1 Tax=Hyalella azteca TaxID=294128 RepID=A0A6A0GSC8_HYAAZ|nr:hypothetical protein HAZT_HAZT004748 [Hyalella azteca]
MEEFIPLMLTTDTRKKITIGCDLLKYISDPANSIECDDIGRVIDGIVPWMQNSNFKVKAGCAGGRLICASWSPARPARDGVVASLVSCPRRRRTQIL